MSGIIKRTYDIAGPSTNIVEEAYKKDLYSNFKLRRKKIDSQRLIKFSISLTSQDKGDFDG